MATPVSSTVLKAFDVIELFTEHSHLTVPHCAELLDIPKSTAYRLLATLREAGVVERTSGGHFRLGFRLFAIGSTASLRVDLTQRSRAPLERLAAETGLAVQLATRSAGHLLYLQRFQGRSMTLPDRVRRESVLHCTALGKTLLAFAESEAVLDTLGGALPRYTDATVTDRGELVSELARVRARGWAEDRGEHVPGVACLAAPVRDRQCDVVSAISISAPSAVVHKYHARLRRLLRATAQRIETGYGVPAEAPMRAAGA